MTFFFVTYYIQIKRKNGSYYFLVSGIAIGIAYFITSVVAQGISGGCLNPMLGFIETPLAGSVLTMMGGKASAHQEMTSAMFVFILGPLIGGMIAGVWQRYVMKGLNNAADAAKVVQAGSFVKSLIN